MEEGRGFQYQYPRGNLLYAVKFSQNDSNLQVYFLGLCAFLLCLLYLINIRETKRFDPGINYPPPFVDFFGNRYDNQYVYIQYNILFP